MTSRANTRAPAHDLTSHVSARYEQKAAKYRDHIPPGTRFFPIVMCAFGALDPRSLAPLAELAEHVSFRLSLSTGDALRTLLTRMRCALWRGNAALMGWAAPSLM